MSGKSTLKSFKAMMSEARLPERTVDLCLRGDLIAEFQALDAELEQARNAAGDSLDNAGGFDFNPDTFWEPLLRACLVDPEITDADEWADFLAGITDYQFNELAIAALTLNRGKVDIPFSPAASMMKRTSDGE
jgi:hypothetical protein